MTALVIGVGALGLGLGGFIGVVVGEDHPEAVGYSSVGLFAAGIFAFGFGLGQILS